MHLFDKLVDDEVAKHLDDAATEDLIDEIVADEVAKPSSMTPWDEPTMSLRRSSASSMKRSAMPLKN